MHNNCTIFHHNPLEVYIPQEYNINAEKSKTTIATIITVNKKLTILILYKDVVNYISELKQKKTSNLA